MVCSCFTHIIWFSRVYIFKTISRNSDWVISPSMKQLRIVPNQLRSRSPMWYGSKWSAPKMDAFLLNITSPGFLELSWEKWRSAHFCWLFHRIFLRSIPRPDHISSQSAACHCRHEGQTVEILNGGAWRCTADNGRYGAHLCKWSNPRKSCDKFPFPSFGWYSRYVFFF